MRITGDQTFGSRQLFILSFAILFLEMACIRWLNATIPILAYFNNLILMSCFLGLGLGCLLANKDIRLIRWYHYVFLVFILSVVLLRKFNIEISFRNEYFFIPNTEGGAIQVSFSALFGFIVNLLLFIVLGQELGKQFSRFDQPLRAYAWDIAGSFFGVISYALLAWLNSPPHVWYCIGLILLLTFIDNVKQVVIAILVLALSLLIMTQTYKDAKWSPYYKVEVGVYKNTQDALLGYQIFVDNVRIQDALNFGKDILQTGLAAWIPYYELPHQIQTAEKILILGAGAGNEAYIAMLKGVKEIHVVEIDPIITNFGYTLHPNRPYKYKNVRVIIDDARSYISSTSEKYDMIIISALDSHKQIAGMTNLRLESFVYTVESFRQIRRLLKPGGIFCLNHISSRPWMGERIYWSLTEAFGKEPIIVEPVVGNPLNSLSFVYGADQHALEAKIQSIKELEILNGYPGGKTNIRLSTDNWPYLYLENNSIPTVLVVVLLILLLVSFLAVITFEPAVRKPSLHFFFLGAGFMLLETRSITQMALLFGSTWVVNAIVFASVFATIFLTNLYVLAGKQAHTGLMYGMLFITLVAGYYFPFESLLDFGFWPRLGSSVVIIGLPIGMASIIFSTSYKNVTHANKSLGSNLLGVVFGGALEYTTNIWGLDSLYLLALVLYFASVVFKDDRTLINRTPGIRP